MENVRIQDDLFNNVNGEKLESLVIPNDRPTAGGFADLDQGVEKLMIADLNAMAKTGECPNEILKNAVTLYKIAKNVKKRNKQGIKPALKTLNKLDAADLTYMNRHLADYIKEGLPLPFNFGVMEDMMDTSKNCLIVQGPQTILPDVTYYKPEMEAQKNAILGIWSNMVKALLAYTPVDPSEHDKYIADALAFDAVIATLVKSSEEWSDYVNIYNPMSLRRVSGLVKPLKLRRALEKVFGKAPETIIVADPRWLKGFKTMFNEGNFEQYKRWAYINELINSCPLLSEDLRALGGTYRRALMGVAQPSSPERHAYQLASRFFSEPLGLYYGEKYFGEAAKKDVIDIVKEIIDTYKKRISDNDFLSQPTKDKAILKLSTMNVKMGYPDRADEFYDTLIVNPRDSLYKAACELGKKQAAREFAKLYQPTDHTKWVMPGNMVNACYNPSSNDITFPAAILQAPFYSVKQSRSQNLGGIGAVIGHEISHAFDNNGAKFDENGNMKDWWTKEDFKQFNARTKAMIREFDGLELPWGKVNGKLVVSENIADNGGMACTLEIMSHTDGADYEEYFRNWARVWCVKAKPEYAAMLLAVDVHSPAILRANMQPRNFDEWYSAFNVKKTDKMYLAPNKRVHIW